MMNLDSWRKSLLLTWEKSNRVGCVSFTSWRGQGCICPGHYTVSPEAELAYSGPRNMMTVFKAHLKSAAIVNMGTIPLLLPVLCIHSSPGFCPKVPVLHLTLSLTWWASAGCSRGHCTGVTHRGGCVGGRWMVGSWAARGSSVGAPFI